jgi:hypothetical protein
VLVVAASGLAGCVQIGTAIHCTPERCEETP